MTRRGSFFHNSMALAAALAAMAAGAGPPAGAIQVDATALHWRAGPPTLPEGTEVAVLEGNPRAPGMFTMRLRVPAGARIAPHRHPRAERVTVLEGAVGVGFGERTDDARMRVFRAGDFYVNPAGAAHFVGFPADSVVQITGEGPWQLEPVAP